MTDPRAELLKQAQRADRLADQATDVELIDTLRSAAKDYRSKADHAASPNSSEAAD